jgi:class 3 adenylate cyclase
VLAGLVEAAGWAFVVGWVVTANPEETMITRDYIEHLTSNSILLGAEFDKIATILTVTAVLALAIQRARRLMVRAIVEQTAARELRRFFAPEAARHISSAEGAISAGEGEARGAAILYTDMRGFTALARTMPASEALALLAEYQARLVPVIQANGGNVDKFLGDGILATFGAALPTETYTADALRAVDALIGEIADWRERRLAAGPPAPAGARRRPRRGDGPGPVRCGRRRKPAGIHGHRRPGKPGSQTQKAHQDGTSFSSRQPRGGRSGPAPGLYAAGRSGMLGRAAHRRLAGAGRPGRPERLIGRPGSPPLFAGAIYKDRPRRADRRPENYTPGRR